MATRPIEFIGVQNRFGESGAPNELIEHYGMVVKETQTAVAKLLKRR